MGAPASPNVDDIIADRYVLERPLGAGGMGTVFIARHRVTGRRVALKWVETNDAVMRERVLREARSLALLSHPNVVGVLDAGEEGQAVFLVMEYMAGKNLRDFVGARALPPEEAVRLLMPALGGVAAAHLAGILHRDLKPENLFVCTDADGSAFDTLVLDFGLAKPLSASTSTALTGRGVILGTPRFMAPEQIVSTSTLDARTDIYALGVILFELLTGRSPYNESQLKPLLLEIMRGDLASPQVFAPELPDDLCAVVSKALAYEPGDRYPDVASFARALEPFAGGMRFEAPRRSHTSDDVANASYDQTLAASNGSGEVEVHRAPTRRVQPAVTPQRAAEPPAVATLQQPPRHSPKPQRAGAATAKRRRSQRPTVKDNAPPRFGTLDRSPARPTPQLVPAQPDTLDEHDQHDEPVDEQPLELASIHEHAERSGSQLSSLPVVPKRSTTAWALAAGVLLALAALFAASQGWFASEHTASADHAAPAHAANLPAGTAVAPSSPAPAAEPTAAEPTAPAAAAATTQAPAAQPASSARTAPAPAATHFRKHSHTHDAAPAPASPAASSEPAAGTPRAVRGRSGMYRAEDF